MRDGHSRHWILEGAVAAMRNGFLRPINHRRHIDLTGRRLPDGFNPRMDLAFGLASKLHGVSFSLNGGKAIFVGAIT